MGWLITPNNTSVVLFASVVASLCRTLRASPRNWDTLQPNPRTTPSSEQQVQERKPEADSELTYISTLHTVGSLLQKPAPFTKACLQTSKFVVLSSKWQASSRRMWEASFPRELYSPGSWETGETLSQVRAQRSIYNSILVYFHSWAFLPTSIIFVHEQLTPRNWCP